MSKSVFVYELPTVAYIWRRLVVVELEVPAANLSMGVWITTQRGGGPRNRLNFGRFDLGWGVR